MELLALIKVFERHNPEADARQQRRERVDVEKHLVAVVGRSGLGNINRIATIAIRNGDAHQSAGLQVPVALGQRARAFWSRKVFEDVLAKQTIDRIGLKEVAPIAWVSDIQEIPISEDPSFV